MNTYFYQSTQEINAEYDVAHSAISGWNRNLSPIKVSEKETISMKDCKALKKKRERWKLKY